MIQQTEKSNVIFGRLIYSDLQGFVFKGNQAQQSMPSLGALVRAQVNNNLRVYGLIYNITWAGDGVVRELAGNPGLSQVVISDSRVGRSGGPEVSVILIGYSTDTVYHALPMIPPSSLEEIVACDWQETASFTSRGFGYFRLLHRARERLPFSDLLAAHLKIANQANLLRKNSRWTREALEEIVEMLKGDYETMMEVMHAIQCTVPEWFKSYNEEEDE